MSKYSVRIGKKHGTVYVQTPKGRVLRYNRVDLTHDQAKRLARRTRGALGKGAKLSRTFWTVVRSPGR